MEQLEDWRVSHRVRFVATLYQSIEKFLGMDTENNHEEHQCRYEAPSGFGVRQPSGTFDWSER
jgi:hypothetical protein